MKVFIFGAGKVGRGLARAARAKKVGPVELRAARRGLPKRPISADLIILAVRDRELPAVAEELVQRKLVGRRAVCVHVAGAIDASPLAVLRPHCAGVAQMHPMISFASTRVFPSLLRGNAHIQGDAAAVVRASAFAKRLGMTPRTFRRLDTVGYHAAAGLVANGAAALAAIGEELLEKSGVPRGDAVKLLGPLLRSVADNVERLGFPDALTGPIRRGELAGFARHLELLRARLPAAVPLFLASAAAQLPLARRIGDAKPEAFDAIEEFLGRQS